MSQQRVSGISAHSSQSGRFAKRKAISGISGLTRAAFGAGRIIHSRYGGFHPVFLRTENYFFQLLPPLEALPFVVSPFTFSLRCRGGRPIV